ncbi:apolipoprotein N-acyltransferase [Undibacterium terreum]|uniref:Apolipoprotein N-acyltransferase n=1 Tax=Undibacterium terreum TaxID=1224302 RepID=A0A916UR28_9BURK|nr:apolipoprotein N-acyltransferase [Undibacterium terreum]GGC84133.1 apolipoprotein N-acyltransferase [Undibacterium terreum]
MTSQTVPASRSRFSHPLWPFAAALLAGCASVLAFAPYNLWPVQILCLALVFHLGWRSTSVKRALLLGWCYGFAYLYLGVSWLLIALTRFGGMPIWISAPALALLVAYMAIYSGLVLGGAVWLRQRWRIGDRTGLLLVMPALWAVGECLRNWLFTGFPWVSIGYAHTSSPLAGYAAVVGVYGVGWVVALIAACLACWSHKKLTLPLIMLVLVVGSGLRTIQWTHASGNPISVRLLQGNVAQDMKFDEAHLVQSLEMYRDMIVAAPADLIATPETAMPLPSTQLPPDYLPLIRDFAHSTNSHVVLGIFATDGPGKYSNSVLGFSPDAKPDQNYRYDKHHLVPFGEFIPTGFHWFVDLMHIPIGDLTSAGLQQAPFQVKDQSVMPNICYEDVFGGEIAAQLNAQRAAGGKVASILLNVSNMAWYGDSSAIPQHLQISTMRVLETGRPMIRSTNTGATAVIDAQGIVRAKLDYNTLGSLRSSVQGTSGMTPYILLGGNTIVIVLALLALALAWFIGRRRSQ